MSAPEDKGGENGGGERSQERIPAAEWLVAALGLVLVAAVVVYLGLEAARPRTPPSVALRVEAVARSGSGYLVRFQARNRGDETAAGLVVEGELTRGGESVETSEATLDYLPGNSERGGGLFFAEDPRGYTLELRALGYEEP